MELTTAQKCLKLVWPAKESNNSARVQPRTAKLCKGIHADLGYSRNGYDVTSYFRSAFVEVRKNGQKFRLRQLRVEFMENGLSEGHEISQPYQGQPAS